MINGTIPREPALELWFRVSLHRFSFSTEDPWRPTSSCQELQKLSGPWFLTQGNNLPSLLNT